MTRGLFLIKIIPLLSFMLVFSLAFSGAGCGGGDSSSPSDTGTGTLTDGDDDAAVDGIDTEGTETGTET